ncbi:hypothetical protein [Jidongwangia harbinensis]|uniref:hypothetical protein n=1 Tax=Jidongwangia harbinensis TaxID=2878561 RepID=UPI001CD94069|nr:hypothetical protein [Jidongwangia harbinensis]MCA2219539.1 hypothetical protein [Jidongwangia harbinensis]
MEGTAPAGRDGDALYRRPEPEPAPEPPPAWPSISDYWPDAPQRMGPAPDFYTAAQPSPAAITEARPTAAIPLTTRPAPRRGRALLTVAAAVLLAAVMAGAGAAYLKNRDRSSAAPETAPPAATGPATSPATSPAAEPIPVPVAPKPTTPPPPAAPKLPATGEFDLVSDASVVNLKTGPLGDAMYRVTAPKGSSVRPVTTVDGSRVRLSLAATGTKGTAAVDVTLNAAVRWNLRVTGGLKTGVLDLGAAKLRGVDLRGGATRMDLTLPRPDGTLTIRMTGGINRFRIHTTARTPARVRAQRGAGKVTLYDLVEDGVRRGQSVVSPTFDRSTDRIDVQAVAGMGTLVLDQT